MLYALLSQPELIERMRPEVDVALDGSGLTPAKVRDMKLVHAATLETLRRYPVAFMLPRTVAQPFAFAGHQLQVGAPIMMATGVAHFDTALYTDPDRFDMDRCLPPRKEHRQPGAFAPYGAGAHTCAGAGFAEVEIMLTAATLLRDFDLAMDPPDYQLKMALNPTPAPNDDFKMRIEAGRA
jgi:cytochrome P450